MFTIKRSFSIVRSQKLMTGAMEYSDQELLKKLMESSAFKIGYMISINHIEIEEPWVIKEFILSGGKLAVVAVCKHIYTTVLERNIQFYHH